MFQRHKSKVMVLRLALLLILAACLTGTRACAAAEDQINQALAASKDWVAQIDAGRYDDSYDFTCSETRDRFPQDHWVEVLKDLRRPWGAVVSREQLRHVYKPNGVPGLNGECVVITYNTNFKNYSNVMEEVVLKWEDGKWRGAGYQAGRVPDPNAPEQASNNSTEVQTQEHVHPQAQ